MQRDMQSSGRKRFTLAFLPSAKCCQLGGEVSIVMSNTFPTEGSKVVAPSVASGTPPRQCNAGDAFADGGLAAFMAYAWDSLCGFWYPSFTPEPGMLNLELSSCHEFPLRLPARAEYWFANFARYWGKGKGKGRRKEDPEGAAGLWAEGVLFSLLVFGAWFG